MLHLKGESYNILSIWQFILKSTKIKIGQILLISYFLRDRFTYSGRMLDREKHVYVAQIPQRNCSLQCLF